MTTKIISAIKATTGTQIVTYDTYADLPISSEDGGLASVTTTGAAGAYQFVASVDDVALGKWIPTEEAGRGLTRILNAGADLAYISTGVGSDNTAAILARGWIDASVGAGSGISDSGGDILVNCADVTGYGGVIFFPVLVGEQDVFVVMEIEALEYNASDLPYGGAQIQWDDDERNAIYSQTLGGLNQGGLAASSTTTAGDGTFAVAAFETVFLRIPWATLDDHRNVIAWNANTGRTLLTDSAAPVSDFPGTVGSRILIWTDTNVGNTSSMKVRELHFFSVG